MRSVRFLFPVILFCLIGCQSQKEPARPNILIIITDDQGWGDLSINGNPYLQTPHIDSLALNGARFSRFYVMPVCSPTRAEILTGRYHVRSNVYETSAGGERIDLDETLLPEIFQKAGYRTAGFGKWHNGGQHPYHPNSRGFEEFYGFCSGHWGNYFNPVLEHNGKLVEGNGYLADDLTDHTIEFIRNSDNRPFLAYLALNTPHSPMQVPEKWWREYEDVDLNVKHRFSNLEDVEHTRAAYAMIANIDYNTGRLIKTLREENLLENTVIVYMSDNGPNGWRWNDGLKGRKGHTDEGGVRSPLHIWWKGKIEHGNTIDQPAAAIDLLPTLTDLAQISFTPERDLDGISLAPILLNRVNNLPDRFIFSYWNGKTSLRNHRFMMDAQGKLFDIQNDPGQHHDISDSLSDEYVGFKHALQNWEKTVLSELDPAALRPFTIGGSSPVILPAADGIAAGNVKRSNRWPNDSYFTDWQNDTDSIYWEVEILNPGVYEAWLYYTCSKENTGLTVTLQFGEERTSAIIQDPNDPPLLGAEDDRVPREESYVKDFKPVRLGNIMLPESTGKLILRASDFKGPEGIEMNRIILTKTD